MTAQSRFAKMVREARREARLTQVELANRLGVSQTVVSLAENGASRIGHRFVQRVLKASGLLAEVVILQLPVAVGAKRTFQLEPPSQNAGRVSTRPPGPRNVAVTWTPPNGSE